MFQGLNFWATNHHYDLNHQSLSFYGKCFATNSKVDLFLSELQFGGLKSKGQRNEMNIFEQPVRWVNWCKEKLLSLSKIFSLTMSQNSLEK